MNKRATDKIISLYWFLILSIVAGAIVYMSALFYGPPYNVRSVEQDILMYRVADCLVQKGYLNEKLILSKNSLSEDDFLKECHLKLDVEDFYNWKDKGQYLVSVEIFELKKDSEQIEEGELKKELFAGNYNLRTLFDSKKISNSGLLRNLYALDSQGNSYKIKILVVIGKIEKNE